MTTSTFEFQLDKLGTQMATRTNGQAFLDEVMNALATHERVIIDFASRSPTPSFADQCLGGLAAHFGLSEFKTRVQLRNVSDAAKPLIRHVVLTRAAKAAAVAA